MMAKKKAVTIVEFSMYELDGDITDVIKSLGYYQQEGVEQGLTNIRLETDFVEEAKYEYGGYQGNYETNWTIRIKGDKDA